MAPEAPTLGRGASDACFLLCDRGERYDRTMFDAAWLRARGLDLAPALEAAKPRARHP